MHAQEAHRGASHLMDNNKNKEMEVGVIEKLKQFVCFVLADRNIL